MLKKEDFTQEFCANLLYQYGEKLKAANALHGTVLTYLGEQAAVKTIVTYILAGLRLGIAGRDDSSRTSRIEHLLERHNVPLDQIQQIKDIKLSMWGVHAKDADGNVVTDVLDSTKITLVPNTPEWPIIDKAAAGPIFPSEAPRLLRKTKTAFVYSDAQIGYLIDPETHELSEIHDSKAMKIAHQIMADVQPSEVAIIGDWMDISFASRWQQHDEFDAPNQSLQAAYDHLRQIKANAGPHLEKFVFVEGNHDQRLEKMLLEHNRSAMRIKRAGDTSNWPVFSLPYLLRFDELGIITTGRYPGGDYYMLPDLMLTHAPPRVAEINASVIHGHTHKLSITPRVAHTAVGRESYYMYDIGCLCQLGITGDLQRFMVTRVPSDRGRTNWHQGVAVINIVEGKIPFHSVDLIAITNHRALYNGQVYGTED